MKYDRFEDLPVWRAGHDLGDRIAAILEHPYFNRRRGLADQFDPASISITNNIAEGFERGTTQELITYLYYARGSAGEVRSMLLGLARRAAAPQSPSSDSEARASELKFQISNLKSEISALIALSESISLQLRGWAEHLQNTDIQGQRRLNKESKAEYDRKLRAATFIEELKRKYPIPRADGRPLPEDQP